MNQHELINKALELGFSAAALIDTKDIIFRPEFRVCCEDNSCGMYGVNYACPPACGTTDEMKERVLAHKKAFVLQTIWEVPDLDDKALLKKDKKKHNAMIREFIKSLPEECQDGFMIAASGCSVCPECSIVKNEPCRFPDKVIGSISAYCINVSAAARKAGMKYINGENTVTYFSVICY